MTLDIFFKQGNKIASHDRYTGNSIDEILKAIESTPRIAEFHTPAYKTKDAHTIRKAISRSNVYKCDTEQEIGGCMFIIIDDVEKADKLLANEVWITKVREFAKTLSNDGFLCGYICDYYRRTRENNIVNANKLLAKIKKVLPNFQPIEIN